MIKNNQPNTLVAMSGGVDSSVAALLLLEQGYRLVGGTLKLFDNKDIAHDNGSCGSLCDADDARRIARQLNFPHYTFDCRTEFQQRVIQRFIAAYWAGETPNPCIDCNRYLKFAYLLEQARHLNMDNISTGHYARREYDKRRGCYLLRKSAIPAKDQSYVLYNLSQEQLSHTLFPLGGLDKETVRQMAQAARLQVADKPDSQDICFVPEGKYYDFLAKNNPSPEPKGNFVDKNGQIIGPHRGFCHYTVGQRKGLNLALGHPVYVTGKNPADASVSVGPAEELYREELQIRDLNLIFLEKIEPGMRVNAKIRYRSPEVPARLYSGDNGNILVRFAEPQKAIAPGQAVVFYLEDIVLGGGTIL
ncbi:MAG: tRNA 2-thiouridine(34) synthase MnmA [Clostridiales bacterium]|nr:tRNA 2-thiouridine(34) synthase MnmA [Clostridiales bacterium]